MSPTQLYSYHILLVLENSNFYMSRNIARWPLTSRHR